MGEPSTSADLHALLSALDTKDKGSANSSEFMRNFAIFEGSLLDKMQSPIRAVHPAGGTVVGGPRGEQMYSSQQPLSPLGRASSVRSYSPWHGELVRSQSSAGSNCRSTCSSASSSCIYSRQVA